MLSFKDESEHSANVGRQLWTTTYLFCVSAGAKQRPVPSTWPEGQCSAEPLQRQHINISSHGKASFLKLPGLKEKGKKNNHIDFSYVCLSPNTVSSIQKIIVNYFKFLNPNYSSQLRSSKIMHPMQLMKSQEGNMPLLFQWNHLQ